MAEGWAKALHADRYQVYSAGIEAHGLNPLAVQVMKEGADDLLLKPFAISRLYAVVSGLLRLSCPV